LLAYCSHTSINFLNTAHNTRRTTAVRRPCSLALHSLRVAACVTDREVEPAVRARSSVHTLDVRLRCASCALVATPSARGGQVAHCATHAPAPRAHLTPEAKPWRAHKSMAQSARPQHAVRHSISGDGAKRARTHAPHSAQAFASEDCGCGLLPARAPLSAAAWRQSTRWWRRRTRLTGAHARLRAGSDCWPGWAKPPRSRAAIEAAPAVS